MRYIAPIFLIVFFFYVPFTQAHLQGNALIDGNYRIELGSFPTDYLVEENISYTIAMETIQGQRILNSSAWIRLAKEDTIIFSSSDFFTEDGLIDFSYEFADPGNYELTVRMVNINSGQEATVVFPLEVTGQSGDYVTGAINQTRSRNLALLTLIIGIIGGWILSNTFQSKNEKSLKK